MKFHFILAHGKEFSIQTMCEVFCVSRAGFYAWYKRPESQHTTDDRCFLTLIKASFKKGREAYGYRRIHQDFRDMNESCGKHLIARLINEHGIHPKTCRKFKVTTDLRHNKPIHPNHLGRQFNAQNLGKINSECV